MIIVFPFLYIWDMQLFGIHPILLHLSFSAERGGCLLYLTVPFQWDIHILSFLHFPFTTSLFRRRDLEIDDNNAPHSLIKSHNPILNPAAQVLMRGGMAAWRALAWAFRVLWRVWFMAACAARVKRSQHGARFSSPACVAWHARTARHACLRCAASAARGATRGGAFCAHFAAAQHFTPYGARYLLPATLPGIKRLPRARFARARTRALHTCCILPRTAYAASQLYRFRLPTPLLLPCGLVPPAARMVRRSLRARMQRLPRLSGSSHRAATVCARVALYRNACCAFRARARMARA